VGGQRGKDSSGEFLDCSDSTEDNGRMVVVCSAGHICHLYGVQLECVCLQDSSLRPTETSSNTTSSFDFFQVNKGRIFHLDDKDLYSFHGSSSAVHTF